jgi:Zn finger protein HypA/HybF involved in hydrogenase expression
VGALTGISPDSMRFYFDAISSGDAELEVTVEPLRATCTVCGARWELPEPRWTCGLCSASALEYANGLELDLVAIEVDDAVDDPDRREDSR